MAAASDLDLHPTPDLVEVLAADHREAAAAVCRASGAIAAAVEAAWPRLAAGGRLIYCGAGTSGRLGLLDAVELMPTFSWLPERALCLMAGGAGAYTAAVEDAEDDGAAGARDMAACNAGPDDVAVCIAASGRTPYTLGAQQAARHAGALTIALANVPGSPLLAQADRAIALDTGPEVLLGSTRLKAGTAQKAALNTLSTALMVRLHKVHGNLMVDLRPTNAKLRARATSLVMEVAGCSADAARQALQACAWRVKHAILMQRLALDEAAAEQRLQQARGSLRGAMAA